MPDTLLSPTAATTEAVLVKAIARMLGDLPYTDTHTNSLASNYTSLTVASDATSRWEIGDYGDWIEDGTYDIFVVTAVAATTLTVLGGQLGSTQQAHAANARFRKRPAYWALNVQRAVNDALNDLWPRLYAVYESQFTSASWAAEATLIKSISETAEEILGAYQVGDATPTKRFPVTSEGPFYIHTALSATKKAIEFRSIPDDNNTIYVQYTRKLGITDLSDGQARAVEYGACARLLEQEGAATKGAASEDSSQQTRDARYFAGRQQEFIGSEAALLRRTFPLRARRSFWPAHHRMGA